ncbi:hypothetical protein JCM17845_27260 [Iodidimonas gelatinilytica]|uniref:Uncharacterized protein n=2 Tax=Iodidimonas gelatinilytica TaxID=1236966 RepID=A0A5A7N1G0_9PROT|nr:hypothetical protein JCM17845_27260 [Iodidimonas gelatinilytica]
MGQNMTNGVRLPVGIMSRLLITGGMWRMPMATSNGSMMLIEARGFIAPYRATIIVER